MRPKLFIHGVPDTPALWGSVLAHLYLPVGVARSPAMPGFGCPVPYGFDCTKEAYLDWLLRHAIQLYNTSGPIDIVGHDWGALLTSRAISVRPDLFAAWTISNAAPHPDYQWHRMARMWQTPILGELVQMLTKPKALAKALEEQGLPTDLAKHEANAFDPVMKKAILKLYRSAKNAASEWSTGFDDLKLPGLVFWGEQDPYVPTWVGEAFAERTGATLKKFPDAAHWSVIEKSEELATALQTLWAET